jgi:glycosyltransferase involved in cell wall biosynthesis
MKTRSCLLFHPSADQYGSDRTLVQLVEALVHDDWQVSVALPGPGPLSIELGRLGVQLHVGGFEPATSSGTAITHLIPTVAAGLGAARRTVALIRRETPSLVYVNTLALPAVAGAAAFLRPPVVWHVHEIVAHSRVAAAVSARALGRFSDAVVCNSNATAAALQAHSSRAARKTRVVCNGVASASLSEPGATAPLVLFVGRLNAWKGQELFVEMAERLADHPARPRFVLAGDAPPNQSHHRRSLRARLRAAEARVVIDWVGFKEDVAQLYDQASLLVVPSLRPEPFGLVAAEAMAHGVPVLAADHGGLREIVEDGVTGVLVKPGDATAFAQAADALLASGRLPGMGRAARARQQELFSVERYQREMLDLFNRLVTKESRV